MNIAFHERTEEVHEHGRAWTVCHACGAQWNDHDEQITEGDGSCADNALAKENIPAPRMRTLACDMRAGCAGEVTHIDDDGFVYCAPHGEQRKAAKPCRKLRAHEVNRLRQGQTVSYRRR